MISINLSNLPSYYSSFGRHVIVLSVPPPARHYNSDLSIWLSVDPMADKYPGVSPYAYCANNPVRLVDPNGEEVEILLGCGADESTRQEALKDLQNAAPNLKLELRGDKLCIGEDGVAKTEYEKHLAEAINSSEFKSEIRLETLNYDQSGSYNGTKFEDNQYISKNSVDLKNTQKYEKETGSVRGQSIGKGEILVPDDIKGPHYQLYVEGHSLATPQPGTWNAKPKRFFK